MVVGGSKPFAGNGPHIFVASLDGLFVIEFLMELKVQPVFDVTSSLGIGKDDFV